MGLKWPIRWRAEPPPWALAPREGPPPLLAAPNPLPLGFSPTWEVGGRVAPLLSLYKEG